MRTLSLSILVAVFAGLFFSCENDKTTTNYTLDVTVSNADDVKVFLNKRRDGEMIKIDSTIVAEGKASFVGNIGLPELYYLSFEGIRAFVGVFIEEGAISVVIDANNPNDPKISGSASHQLYEGFNESQHGFDERSKSIVETYNRAREVGNEDQMKEAEAAYQTMDEEKASSANDFIKQNSSSTVAPYLVVRYSYRYDLDELEAFVNGFDPSISTSFYVEYLVDRVNTLKSVSVGQPFVDFELSDTEGNPLSLSTVAKDKYLLVDFWAAWCGPCRAENPNVVEAYNKFHDKGFDVLGVSFDDDHAKWIEAIEKDGLTWQQISDLKGWGSTAGKLYGIQSIPQNVLIDPDGIIIEKNLRGEDLQEKLEEIFAD